MEAKKVWRHSVFNMVALAWLSKCVVTNSFRCDVDANQYITEFCETCMIQITNETAEGRSCVIEGNGLDAAESHDHGGQAFQYGRCCIQPDCTVE